MPRRRRRSSARFRAHFLGESAGCTPHRVQFVTRDGREVAFVGRDTRSGDCPVLPRPAPKPAQTCAADVFRRAVNFCAQTSRSKLQQRLCIGPSTQVIAAVAKCKERA
jgi:hypothetical protein